MKQLKQPNEKVIAFIKTNSPESEGLRPASWTVSFSEGSVNLMKNMFSGEVVRPALIDEKCRDCAFLSVCTPFYKTNCPDYFEYCAEYQQFKTEYELRKLAEKKVRDA